MEEYFARAFDGHYIFGEGTELVGELSNLWDDDDPSLAVQEQTFVLFDTDTDCIFKLSDFANYIPSDIENLDHIEIGIKCVADTDDGRNGIYMSAAGLNQFPDDDLNPDIYDQLLEDPYFIHYRFVNILDGLEYIKATLTRPELEQLLQLHIDGAMTPEEYLTRPDSDGGIGFVFRVIGAAAISDVYIKVYADEGQAVVTKNVYVGGSQADSIYSGSSGTAVYCGATKIYE